MATLTPTTAKGKTRFEANSWRTRDNAYDPMSGGSYNHTDDRFSATEADEWVSWMFFINTQLLSGGLGVKVRNETGGSLAAGPVKVSSYDAAENRFLITLADADANAPAHAVLLAALANNTNGTAYIGGDLTYDTSGYGAVGDPAYLAADGTLTKTAPTGADQVVQIIGEVKVKDASGTIACYVRTPKKIGTSYLQDDAITSAKIVDAAVTYAKIQNVSASAKLLGRKTSGAGDVEEVACDESTIELPAAGSIRVKDNGITLAKIVAATAQGKILGRSTAAGGNFEEVACDDSTVELPAGGTIRVKDSGITSAKLASAVQDQIFYLTVTAAAEAANNVDITFQVKDAAGNNLSDEFLIEMWMADSATGWECSTAPSGGLSVTTGVAADVPTASKRIRFITNTSGTAVVRATETGALTLYCRAEINGEVVTDTCTWTA